MKDLSAFIIKFNELNDEENEALDTIIENYLEANFEISDCNNMIVGEDGLTLIFFVNPKDKHKVDDIVQISENFIPGVIKQHEDVTNKFLYENDYSDFEEKAVEIHNFIKCNLDQDDVYDKIKKLGADKLTDADRQIIHEAA